MTRSFVLALAACSRVMACSTVAACSSVVVYWAAVACSSEPRHIDQAPHRDMAMESRRDASRDVSTPDAAHAATGGDVSTPDAAHAATGGDVSTPDAAPASVDAAITDPIAELRARGFAACADSIERRAAQSAPKMKLTPEQARAAAFAVLAIDRESTRALAKVMPRSLVELARAVAERGVSVDEADAIARYLVRVVETLAFKRLVVFDENHSHVCGREWREIDYTGEGMTWQSQRDDWTPKGVVDFKRARHIHAYFVGAEKLPHWKRVYRPRGRMADVAPP